MRTGVTSRASLRQNLQNTSRGQVPSTPLKPSMTTSQESLDSCGPKSLGSEDGDMNSFKESRLGGSFMSRILNRSRVQSSPSQQSLNLNTSQTFSLPPVSPRTETRPTSGIVTLPPISHSQGITRPQIRRQLRLSSAPLSFDSNANTIKEKK